MTRAKLFVPALAIALLLVGAAGPASAATPGYVVYRVQFSYPGVSHAFTVNESVSASHSAGYDKLTLGVSWDNSSFTYSTLVNSSLDISPFIPSISNQSFEYTSNGTSIALSLVKNGSLPVQFHGSSYTLTSYAARVTVAYNGTTETISGALTTFPSGLVYSASASGAIPNLPDLGNLTTLGQSSTSGLVLPGFGSLPFSTSAVPSSGTATLKVTLLSTSLPLSGPAPSMTEQVASFGIGAGAVASVLALGLGVRSRRSHHSGDSPKPEYAVD